ncbi:NTP pyrophosphohydrolase including oxidative damage repair enzyme [Candidatus Terasakiella magnetica]|nr:NTP pyrophosphohydrolase including oxidative damage repair enzyme [Candidatus Terasakiella magnetica]
MSYLDHIVTCNRHDPDRFRPFRVEGAEIGRVRHDVAGLLAEFADVFKVSDGAVDLHPGLGDPESRSAALDRVSAALSHSHGTPRLRGERYRVARRFGDAPVMNVDRGAASLFGIRAFGIHVNGMVRRQDGLHLWIGRRAPDKSVAPGKLDNMVAGGQPSTLSLMDNLLKEAAEEADIPAVLAATSRPVGAIAYCMEDEWGLKPDVMFCYDLEVPEDFTPRNTDGEISGFTLMPIAEVARRVRDGDDFKFNVNLVITDFLIRHGLISPDQEPDYVDLVAGLRTGW